MTADRATEVRWPGQAGSSRVEAAVARQGDRGLLCLRGWVFFPCVRPRRGSFQAGLQPWGWWLIGPPWRRAFWPCRELEVLGDARAYHAWCRPPASTAGPKAVITPIAAACVRRGGKFLNRSDRAMASLSAVGHGSGRPAAFRRWGCSFTPIHGPVARLSRRSIPVSPGRRPLAQLGLSAAANEAGSAVGATNSRLRNWRKEGQAPHLRR